MMFIRQNIEHHINIHFYNLNNPIKSLIIIFKISNIKIEIIDTYFIKQILMNLIQIDKLNTKEIIKEDSKNIIRHQIILI